MPLPIDPRHEDLHRVLLADLEKYKAGVFPTVTAICGKVWSPNFPVDRSKNIPKCPVCFPTEQLRYAIAK